MNLAYNDKSTLFISQGLMSSIHQISLHLTEILNQMRYKRIVLLQNWNL